jgi:hypothetical protein
MNWYKKISQEKSLYRNIYPKVRGGWNMDKIRKNLRNISSGRGEIGWARSLSKFESPEEVSGNLYYHGTGGVVSGGLKPGFIQTRVDDSAGGSGYGYVLHSISLSKDKDIASNFSGMSRYGTVYPVLLNKGASVISMQEIEDSSDLEDILPSLWDRGIDAVKIGDWDNPDYGEKELVVLNPKAITIGKGETFPVFQKKKFQNPDIDEIAQMWTESKEKIKEYEDGSEERSRILKEKHENDALKRKILFEVARNGDLDMLDREITNLPEGYIDEREIRQSVRDYVNRQISSNNTDILDSGIVERFPFLMGDINTIWGLDKLKKIRDSQMGKNKESKSIDWFSKISQYNTDFIDTDRLGCCMFTSEVITKQLLRKGINNFKVIEGYVTFADWRNVLDPVEHTWIEMNNKEIIDPSKEQFKQWGYDPSEIQYLKKQRKEYSPEEYLGLSREHPIPKSDINSFLKKTQDIDGNEDK